MCILVVAQLFMVYVNRGDDKVVAKKDGAKKETKDSPPAKVNEGGLNLTQFFAGTKEELSKVVWPSRQQLISESVAVVSMVVLVATLIYFIDQFFSWGAGKVFG